MKTASALLILLLSCFISSAQITITASDMPSDGDIFTYSLTPDLWNTNAASTGASYTWDFSFLTPQSQRSDTFVSVSSTPFAYQFFFNNQFLYPDHHSDHAVRLPTGGGPQGGGPVSISNAFNYFRVDNDAYIQTGFGANINGVPSSIQYDPRDFIYRFPMTMGSMDGSVADYLIVVPTLGAYGQTIDRSNEVDGWGTVITPLGSFQALRLKTTITYTDTFFIDQVGFGTSFTRPPTTEYHWLTQGGGTPVLSITEVNQGPTTTSFFTYQDTIQTVGVEGAVTEALQIHPNPASSYFTVSGFPAVSNGPAEVVLYDMEGKMHPVRTSVQGAEVKVQRDGLAAGIYLLEVRQDGRTWHEKVLFRD